MTNIEIIKGKLEYIKEMVQEVEDKIESLKSEKQDKFAELKEAHKNGAVIQCKVGNVSWSDCEPIWSIHFEYRIKPEDRPKVGDVCKFWDWDENKYVVARLEGVKGDTSFPYASDTNDRYRNAKKLTKEEAIELLFGNDNQN